MTDLTLETRAVAQKWGFGMAPPKPKTQALRVQACEILLEILSSRRFGELAEEEMEAISTVKGMFNRTVRSDQWDWFSVKAQLGYPAIPTARTIASKLTDLRSSIKMTQPDRFETARIDLRRLPVRECLDVFLGRKRLARHPNAGWVYVLSTRELRDLLKVGMTRRTVEERVREINQATGVAIPFGVRRCWRVRSPEVVERLAHKELASFRFRSDREFFRIQFHRAEKILNSVIRSNEFEIRTLHVTETVQ